MTRTVRALEESELKGQRAPAVLLNPAYCRFGYKGHTVLRDSDGLWLTDPYGNDVGVYAATRKGAEALVQAIANWCDPFDP